MILRDVITILITLSVVSLAQTIRHIIVSARKLRNTRRVIDLEKCLLDIEHVVSEDLLPFVQYVSTANLEKMNFVQLLEFEVKVRKMHSKYCRGIK